MRAKAEDRGTGISTDKAPETATPGGVARRSSPDQLTGEEIHQWQIHFPDVRKVLWSAFNVDMSAPRFFCRRASCGGGVPVESGRMADMSYEGIITVEPGKRGGQPCIRGMRITVYDVLSYLASGMTEEQVLADFPYLTREDILACLSYAAEREHRILVANE